MDPFRDNVFYLLLGRALLATLIGVVLMVTNHLELGPTLFAAAHLALLFSLSLVAWAEWVNEDRVSKLEAWRRLAARQRPAGPVGRLRACICSKEIGLRFAEVSSAVAITLAVSSIVLVGGP
ncbi:MAG: hypothetical protein AB1490_13885 [Pseudomonadota bacterium]